MKLKFAEHLMAMFEAQGEEQTSAESSVPKKTQSNEKVASDGKGQYLSMTYTEYVNGKNADQGMVMRV